MNQKIKAPKIVIIFSLTLITVVFWAAFEVYRSVSAKPTETVAKEILEPINPVLDAQALSNIQTRIHLDESQIRIATPEVQEIVVATSSATPEPVSEATSSATPTP